jgi:cytochrome c
MRGALRLAAVGLGLAVAATGAMSQDLDNGKSQFNKCRACHDVGDGAKTKVGPVLNDIVGRKAATIDGFAYSESLKKLGADGFTWTEENLQKYLENPKSVVPDGKMVFAGLKDKDDRTDVIAYLKQFTKK